MKKTKKMIAGVALVVIALSLTIIAYFFGEGILLIALAIFLTSYAVWELLFRYYKDEMFVFNAIESKRGFSIILREDRAIGWLYRGYYGEIFDVSYKKRIIEEIQTLKSGSKASVELQALLDQAWKIFYSRQRGFILFYKSWDKCAEFLKFRKAKKMLADFRCAQRREKEALEFFQIARRVVGDREYAIQLRDRGKLTWTCIIFGGGEFQGFEGEFRNIKLSRDLQFEIFCCKSEAEFPEEVRVLIEKLWESFFEQNPQLPRE